MKQNKTLDDVKVKRETTKIYMGIFLAVFGCLMILSSIVIPPVGVIDGSVLTAVGEVFSLSGACLAIFSFNRRDNAKIDYIYNSEKQRNEHETETGEEV